MSYCYTATETPLPVRGQPLIEALEEYSESAPDPVAAILLQRAAAELLVLEEIVYLRTAPAYADDDSWELLE